MRTPREEAHATLAKGWQPCPSVADTMHTNTCDDVTAAIENARAEGAALIAIAVVGGMRGEGLEADRAVLAELGISRDLYRRKIAELLE